MEHDEDAPLVSERPPSYSESGEATTVTEESVDARNRGGMSIE